MRVYAARVLADTMRTYAPDAPYEGETIKVRKAPLSRAPGPPAPASRTGPLIPRPRRRAGDLRPLRGAAAGARGHPEPDVRAVLLPAGAPLHGEPSPPLPAPRPRASASAAIPPSLAPHLWAHATAAAAQTHCFTVLLDLDDADDVLFETVFNVVR